MTRTEAIQRVEACIQEARAAATGVQGAAGALLEATVAQQRARQIEKDGEAAIIAANPDDMFTPRKTSQAEKDAYLRGAMGDTYRARAMAEEALAAAQHEKTIAEIRAQTANVELWAATAILYALTIPEGASVAMDAKPPTPFQTNLNLNQ